MLKPKRRRSIETAISNEVAPTRSKSHDLLLRFGGKQYAKLQTRGQTTPTGRFYFQQINNTAETYYTNGTVVRMVSSEYLLLRVKASLLRRTIISTHDSARHIIVKRKCRASSMSQLSLNRPIPTTNAGSSRCRTTPSWIQISK